MTAIRTTPPAAEPVTLAQAKLHLRVDGSDDDDLITLLIAAARANAEDRLQRTLITTTWVATFASFAGLTLPLPMAPVQAVSSVAYVDALGASQTLDSSAYRVDLAAALVQPSDAWPSDVASNTSNAVTVAYTAGFGSTAADVPAPIRQWLLLAIGDMYANRERSSDKPAVPQQFADGLLDPYKVWAL